MTGYQPPKRTPSQISHLNRLLETTDAIPESPPAAYDGGSPRW